MREAFFLYRSTSVRRRDGALLVDNPQSNGGIREGPQVQAGWRRAGDGRQGRAVAAGTVQVAYPVGARDLLNQARRRAMPRLSPTSATSSPPSFQIAVGVRTRLAHLPRVCSWTEDIVSVIVFFGVRSKFFTAAFCFAVSIEGSI
jgi:hypothetical protein